MFKKLVLLLNTVKYLKFVQINHRILRVFIKPRVIFKDSPKIAVIKNNFEKGINSQQCLFEDGTVRIFDSAINFENSDNWNPSSKDKLWIYNLHYFNDLNSKGSDKRNYFYSNIVTKWIHDNPKGFGNGWESYPLSLRIVNWIKWLIKQENLNKIWLDSLANQTRFLSKNLEYHLLGNHLIANAKALIFSGLYFKGDEADSWYKTGISIFTSELKKQILDDGGHFELSPMYHSIILEDLLDVINIHKAYNKSLKVFFKQKAITMIEWLKIMCHPDGEISFFNDSSIGVAPSLKELINFASDLKLKLINDKVKRLSHLNHSGYIVYRAKNITLLADVAEIGASYLPGHGHADTLSFELSLFGERLIVNSGISTYALNDDRLNQRSTISHSTITIDDRNSSEVWSGFRVADRAHILDLNIDESYNNVSFSACHDGYKKIKGNVIHFRKWNISDNLLTIKDEISGAGNHKITSVLPIHPNVSVTKQSSNIVLLEQGQNRIKIIFEGKGFVSVRESKWHPKFGVSINNKQLTYNYNGNLPFESIIKILWEKY
jgi:uncharacterized heparinase superfamily protein